MSEFKLPHVEDLTTNSKLPGQLAENFKVIEQAANDLRGEIDSEEQDRKSEDTKLNGQIDDTNTRLDNLDKQKATHDDVNDLRDELLKKIKHIILGTDEETVKTVIQEMKKEGTI